MVYSNGILMKRRTVLLRKEVTHLELDIIFTHL